MPNIKGSGIGYQFQNLLPKGIILSLEIVVKYASGYSDDMACFVGDHANTYHIV